MAQHGSDEAAAVALLNVRKASAALGISERTLWEITRSGELPCVRVGRRVLYDPQDLRAFIDRQKGAAR